MMLLYYNYIISSFVVLLGHCTMYSSSICSWYWCTVLLLGHGNDALLSY